MTPETMTLDSLYPLVSEAIRRAEILDDLGAPGAEDAYADVSLIEERIAELVSPTDEEGALARRGAIRSAMSAGDMRRARSLAERFVSEEDSTPELRQQIAALVDDLSASRLRASAGSIRPIALNTGGPVDPADVVGRDADVRAILDALQSTGVILTGPRRVGKTSVAGVVAHEALESGWDVIVQSVEGFSSVAEVAAALDARSGVAQPLEPASHDEHGLRLLECSLTAAVRASREKLLLILDEVPVFVRTLEHAQPGEGIAVLHLLRRLRQEHPARLRMILLGSLGFHHVTAVDQGVLNDLVRVTIGPLAPEDGTFLAASLFRFLEAPIAYEHDLAPVVAQHAEGLPFLIHQLVADIARAHPQDASAADVERIVDEALVSLDDRWSLRHYLHAIKVHYAADADLANSVLDAITRHQLGLSDLELVGYLAAARQLEPLEAGRLWEVVRRLEIDQYVERDDDRLLMPSRLMRRLRNLHASGRAMAPKHDDLARMAAAASAALGGDRTAFGSLSDAQKRVVEELVAVSSQA